MPKLEVTNAEAAFLELIRQAGPVLKDLFGDYELEESEEEGEEDGEGEITQEYIDSLSLKELREFAAENGYTDSTKKADILKWVEDEYFSGEEAEEEDEEEEEVEEEGEEEEDELLAELRDLSRAELVKRAKTHDIKVTKNMSEDRIIDLIFDAEQETEEEEEEEEEEEQEEVDIEELKSWPLSKLLAKAEELEIEVPDKLKRNKKAVIQIFVNSFGAAEEE